MNEQQIRQIAHEEATKVYNNLGTQYGVSQTPIHEHDGVDSPQINPGNLLGFPIMTTVPTNKPFDGTIRLYNAGGVRKIYAFISGTWYSTTIT